MTTAGAAGFPNRSLGTRPCAYTSYMPRRNAINISHSTAEDKLLAYGHKGSKWLSWDQFPSELCSVYILSLPIHSMHPCHLLVPLSSVLIKVTMTSKKNVTMISEWQNQVEGCLTLFQSLGHIQHSSPLLFQVLCWGYLPTRECPSPFWQDPLLNWSLSWGRVPCWASPLQTLCSLSQRQQPHYYPDSQGCIPSSDSLPSTQNSFYTITQMAHRSLNAIF